MLAGIQKALSDAFPEHQFSYIVAGTSTSLRSLKDNLIPFAITHNPDNEKKLTTEGMFARYPLYANDFLIVGPEESDLDCDSMKECLESIFSLKLPFTSRGDQSGTHLFELDRWAELGIEPTENDFYQQASGGAASSLRICEVTSCFLIVDESTFTKNSKGVLIEIARYPGANIYSLVCSEEACNRDLMPIADWIRDNVPSLSETYGYRPYR